MPIIYHNTPSAGVAPRTNDQALQTNWRDIMELVPHDSLPVHFRSVLPWLFRSNIPFPQQLQAIYATGVRSIITLTESRELFEDARSTGQLPDDMTIHHYPVNQRHYLTLSEIINVCRIIHEARSVGNVMVNCLGGMTRTGLVIGANHAIFERHEPLDHFDRCIGLRDFVRRGVDFLTLSHTPISRAEMLTRFYAIQENAQKLGKTVPKFLHPHYGTFNWNALWELSALGGIGQLPEFLTTEEDYSIPLPTGPQHRQAVSQTHSGDIETPSMVEGLTT